MDWLWQGIITSIVCFLLSKLFSFIKKCVLVYYHYEKSVATSKVVFNLFWKTYIYLFINSTVVCYILFHVDIESIPFIFLIVLLFTINNFFLFYSVDNARKSFAGKKANKSSDYKAKEIDK